MKLTVSFMIVFSMLLTGCEALPKRDASFAPTQAMELELPKNNTGAIFQAGQSMSLFEDLIARQMGDLLTVKLEEDTQAKKKADLDTTKDNSISVTAPNVAGLDPSLIFGTDLSSTLASNHEFEGEGEANQSNSLQGDISVTVVRVLPNGNLVIRGEKRLTLNDGSEYIRLSGIVRPVDIDETNTISSSKIADATIMYTGDGSVADASKIGWFARFFLSPAFPF